MSFFNPAEVIDNSMRPIPFWSLNDKLQPDELRRQIQAMHQAGFGGFFMHARGGLQTQYMSQDWFDCVIACVEEAEKLNMEAWLYDENGWPSGYADGKVNGLGEEYQQKFIILHDGIYWDEPQKIVAIYRKSDGKRVDSYDDQTCEYYTLTYGVNPCYVDIFNPAATDEFIKNTHQYYYDNLPLKIRDGIKGIFTDEPQIVIGKVFYSEYYAEEFEKRYGTNLFDDLIKIWYDYDNCEEFRMKYYSLAGELFAENYTKKIHDWCREHNWLLTGHMVQEITYAEQCFSSGAVSYHYPFFDIAGIDHLGRVRSSSFTIRQMTSVAAQFGIKRRMTEIFACLGWDLSCDDIRYYYHILQVYGVNFLCHHLFAYSLRGLRKRDYPPSFGTHVPYFANLKKLNDEFARTNQFITQGREMVSCLLFHAQSSVWTLYHGDNEEIEVDSVVKSTEEIAEKLGEMQVPFHFGFEPHLIKYGKIENGKLKLGECLYDTVVLPKITFLCEETYKLLREFKGRIYRTDDCLKQIGSEKIDDEAYAWFMNLPILGSDLSGIIEVDNSKTQIRSNCYEFDNGRCYMVINCDSKNRFAGQVKFINESCRLWLIDANDGSKKEFYEDELLSLDVGEAIWVFAEKNSIKTDKKVEKSIALSEICINDLYFKEVPNNYLLLDNVRYSINNETWKQDDVSVVQWELLRRGNGTLCDMEFEFFVDEKFDLSTELNIIVETPEIFEFKLNNQAFEIEVAGYAFDRAFKICRLPSEFLKVGKNIISLHLIFEQSDKVYQQLDKCKYFETAVNALSFDMEIEPIYIMGKFALQGNCIDSGDCRIWKPQMKICNFDSQMAVEDFSLKALPFFCGKTTFNAEFEITENLQLYNLFTCELVNFNAVKIAVNGIEIGCDDRCNSKIAIPSNVLKLGKNILEIEVVSNLRNFMGPFHVPQKILFERGVSPGTFGKAANVFNGNRTPIYEENYYIKKTEIKNIKITKG